MKHVSRRFDVFYPLYCAPHICEVNGIMCSMPVSVIFNNSVQIQHPYRRCCSGTGFQINYISLLQVNITFRLLFLCVNLTHRELMNQLPTCLRKRVSISPVACQSVSQSVCLSVCLSVQCNSEFARYWSRLRLSTLNDFLDLAVETFRIEDRHTNIRSCYLLYIFLITYAYETRMFCTDSK